MLNNAASRLWDLPPETGNPGLELFHESVCFLDGIISAKAHSEGGIGVLAADAQCGKHGADLAL